MKITTRLVLQYFLKKLSAEMKKTNDDELDPFFDTFFLKEELTIIYKWAFDQTDASHRNMELLKANDLLEFLTNQHILDYYRAQWENEIERNLSITVDSVIDTLEQLGLHTHYLRTKPIDTWDEYDFSNYRALSEKAGKVYAIYGMYDAEVNKKDAHLVTSPSQTLL